ncbi:MAG: mechanosensitive ion channel family protein [Oligoflexales bacterium]
MLDSILQTWIIYPTIITAFLVGIFVYVFYRFSIIEAQKKKNIKSRANFEAIKTDTPFEDPQKNARKRALKSVEQRFRFFRKFFVIAIFVVWCFLILPIPAMFIPNSYIPVFLGVMTVFIGIAAKPMFENIFSGLVINFDRSLRIGDTVEIDEHYGTVEEFHLTYVIIKVWDWRRYIVPYSKLLSKEFVNLSVVDKFQLAHVEFTCSLDVEAEKVKQISREAVKKSKYFAPYEEPMFWVMDLNETSISCWVAGWVDSPSDAWALAHDIRTNIWEDFRKNGIKLHRFENNLHVKNLPINN